MPAPQGSTSLGGIVAEVQDHRSPDRRGSRHRSREASCCARGPIASAATTPSRRSPPSFAMRTAGRAPGDLGRDSPRRLRRARPAGPRNSTNRAASWFLPRTSRSFDRACRRGPSYVVGVPDESLGRDRLRLHRPRARRPRSMRAELIDLARQRLARFKGAQARVLSEAAQCRRPPPARSRNSSWSAWPKHGWRTLGPSRREDD